MSRNLWYKTIATITKIQIQKFSAIFYPIVHQKSLIGLVRQYIYHSVPISISSFEISYEELEFVTKSIFTTFELSYSFEGMRKENDIVERKYAMKVLEDDKKDIRGTQKYNSWCIVW